MTTQSTYVNITLSNKEKENPMNYYDDIPKNIDNIDKLISYYQSNNSKIDELNVINDLLKIELHLLCEVHLLLQF